MENEKNKAALEAEAAEVREETTEAAEVMEDAPAAIEETAEAAAETAGDVPEAAEEAAEEVTEAAGDVPEAAEEAAEEVTESAEDAPEAPEEAMEEAADPAEEAEAEEKPVKVSSKRLKKIERREAKAARKAANAIEEKKSRPNNAVIAIMIFGVVVGMFAFVLGYNFFSKPATIAKYIEENGGEEVYSGVQLDMYSTADITAEGNSLKIDMTVIDEDAVRDQAAEFYKSEDGEKELKQLAAYLLTNMKPSTRAFSADVSAVVRLGDEEIQSVKMTYREAKDYLKELEKEAEEAAAAEEEGAAEDEAAEAEEGTAEDAAAEAGEGAGEDAAAADEEESAAEDAAAAAEEGGAEEAAEEAGE